MPMKLIAKCLLLFLIILGIQAWNELRYVLILIVIFSTITLIKTEGGNFQQHGFHVPETIVKYFLLSLFLAVFYVTITIFLSGSTGKFEAYPPFYPFEILESISTTLLNAVVTEIVFRGYIQISLMSILDFSHAITATSIMFTLYMLPASLTGPQSASLILVMLSILSIFMESMFLCSFFNRTKTLLCPIMYNTSVNFLYTTTPIRPISSEYGMIASVSLYIFFILVLWHLTNYRNRNSMLKRFKYQ